MYDTIIDHPVNGDQESPTDFFRKISDSEELYGRTVILNRQSSPGNRKKYVDKVDALQGKKIVEFHPLTGSGSLRELIQNHFFDALHPMQVLKKDSYFIKLRNVLLQELLSLPAGQKLIVKIFSLDRLFRPSIFDPRDKSTWNPTDFDFEIFGEFLKVCLDEREGDVVFQILHDGTPGQIRRIQSECGQKNGRGGRPKKIERPSQTETDPRVLAIQLARTEGLNASQVRRRLVVAGFIVPTPRTFQRWLKSENLQGNAGRPCKK